LNDIGRKDVNWIHMAQDTTQWWALSNTVTNLRIPKNVENFLAIWATISFSSSLAEVCRYKDWK